MTNAKHGIELPEDMRRMIENGLHQAREGVSRVIAAAGDAAASLERKADAMQGQAHDVRKKNQMFAEVSMASAFDLAEKLLQAKNLDEVTRLQKDYATRQFAAFREHFAEAGEDIQRQTKEMASELAGEATKFRDAAQKAFEEGVSALKDAGKGAAASKKG